MFKAEEKSGEVVRETSPLTVELINLMFSLICFEKNFKAKTVVTVLGIWMSAKWLNSRTYGLAFILFCAPGVFFLVASRFYFLPNSSQAGLFFLLGLSLIVISGVFLVFYYVTRWQRGQPEPRPEWRA